MSWSSDDPRLTLYLLGDLSPEENAELEALLPQRPDLQAVLDELRPTLSLLEKALSTQATELPGGLNDMQKERVIAEAAKPERTNRPSWFMRNATSIAAVLVLFVGVGLVLRNEMTTVPVEPRPAGSDIKADTSFDSASRESHEVQLEEKDTNVDTVGDLEPATASIPENENQGSTSISDNKKRMNSLLAREEDASRASMSKVPSNEGKGNPSVGQNAKGSTLPPPTAEKLAYTNTIQVKPSVMTPAMPLERSLAEPADTERLDDKQLGSSPQAPVALDTSLTSEFAKEKRSNQVGASTKGGKGEAEIDGRKQLWRGRDQFASDVSVESETGRARKGYLPLRWNQETIAAPVVGASTAPERSKSFDAAHVAADEVADRSPTARKPRATPPVSDPLFSRAPLIRRGEDGAIVGILQINPRIATRGVRVKARGEEAYRVRIAPVASRNGAVQVFVPTSMEDERWELHFLYESTSGEEMEYKLTIP